MADQVHACSQVHDGYPTNYVTNNYLALCVPWDPVTRLPLQNTSDIYPTPGQTVALGGSNFQFNFNYDNFGVSIGDYITVRVPLNLEFEVVLHVRCMCTEQL